MVAQHSEDEEQEFQSVAKKRSGIPPTFTEEGRINTPTPVTGPSLKKKRGAILTNMEGEDTYRVDIRGWGKEKKRGDLSRFPDYLDSRHSNAKGVEPLAREKRKKGKGLHDLPYSQGKKGALRDVGQSYFPQGKKRGKGKRMVFLSATTKKKRTLNGVWKKGRRDPIWERKRERFPEAKQETKIRKKNGD